MKTGQEAIFSQISYSRKIHFTLTALLCLVMSVLITGGSTWLGRHIQALAAHAYGHVNSPPKTHVIPTSTVDPSVTMTETLATHYMNALLAQDYQTMWQLLHPAIQAKWPNEAAFATYWKTRFHDYTLAHYTLGTVQPLALWVDPETLTQYNNLEELHISLQITLTQPVSSATMPPEVQNPSSIFQNLPFIVQHSGNGTWSILVGGPADLEAPILPPAITPTTSVQVPILMYHHISDGNPQPAPYYWNVTIEHFQQQMDYLAAHGYHPITFNMLFDTLYYGFTLPAKPLILTFDDGREDAYQNAYPILVAHHFSAMFYIPSGWVGQSGQMTWPQLREMLAHGMQMGAHTIDHVDFQTLLASSLTESQRQLQQSKQTLEQQLGMVIQHFCYPYGEPFYVGTWYERQEIVKMLAADGYIDATVAVGVVSGIVQTSQAPFALPRVPVFGFENLASFVARLPAV